jgi:hypothetical protein
MKRKENDSIRASTLQIALIIALGLASAMLMAASLASQAPEGNVAGAARTAPERSSSDTPAAPFTVTNTNDSGPGSLRQAITDANAMPDSDMINFNIPSNSPGCNPTSHVCTITLGPDRMPSITTPMTIDGYTQPGAHPNTNARGGLNTVLKIQISGANLGAVAPFEILFTSNVTIRGLVINHCQTGITVNVGTSNVRIEGNFIGTDPSGTATAGSAIGIDISTQGGAAQVVIGGADAAARNLISGNSTFGISSGFNFNGFNDYVVQGNLIGTDVSGQVALGNRNGIAVNAFTPTVFAALNNVISGNTETGIGVGDSGVGGSANSFSGTIQRNLIGVAADGVTPLGNGLNGIAVGFSGPRGPTSSLIGGTDSGQGNVIAFNNNDGVLIGGVGITSHKILGNSIFANAALGIDLANDGGVTANDGCDADTGANNLQNFPVITSASFSGGMVRISGTLNSLPNTMFRLEFFSSAQGDPSGNGEGQTFLGSANRATNGSCNASFGPLSFPVPPGQRFVTATATRLDAMGNPIETSEFSALVAGPQPSPTPTPTATPTRSRLRNISTRSFVQTGDNVMIGGFIVHGATPKRVIIRAIGPELTRFGVPNVLADPTLELHNGTGALIARNDNWQHTIIGGIIGHDQVQEIRQSGLPPGDFRESAIIAELPAGNYTAIVRGINVSVGVALVEVYDLALEAPPILFNISTRSFVQTGDNVMIGGFIVHGTGLKRVIIRAIGPELSQFGVPDPLQNPTLELHNGPGALIGSNDNWRTTIIGGIITHDQVQEIRNSGLAPGDGRESAIIAELPPGNYTAIVRGVNSTTGIALVEVYDLD